MATINTDIQTVSQDHQAETVKTSMNIPADVHRFVRIEAINRGMDAQDIYVAAVREYLNIPTA